MLHNSGSSERGGEDDVGGGCDSNNDNDNDIHCDSDSDCDSARGYCL